MNFVGQYNKMKSFVVHVYPVYFRSETNVSIRSKMLQIN